jgi:glycyl-tRNA synthetase
MQYTDNKTGQRYIPRCVEASTGLGRQIMVTMLEFYDEELVKEGDTRVVIRFPKQLAPIKFAVLPLMEKDETMSELARKIFASLKKKGYTCEYDGGGNIGKRYRRQDEIGTPYCVTVDHQSLEDGTVTVRERDSMEQVRVKWEEVVL